MAVLVGAITASFTMRYQRESRIREKDKLVRSQHDQLEVLTAERQRLSNLVVRAKNLAANDHAAELSKNCALRQARS